MFEATLNRGAFWKKVVEAMKDLVSEANFECTPKGMSIQSIDQSHVALVSLTLLGSGFDTYECHRQQVLGVNLNNLAKLLKVNDDKDTVTLRHQEDTDNLIIGAEADGGKKSTEFSLKLMEIEQEALGIPDEEQDYKAVLSMPADIFAKTCRDMATFGDTMTIEISREKVKFSGTGDLGTGNITIQSQGAAEKAPASKSSVLKTEGSVKTEKGVKPEKTEKTEPDAVKAEPADEEAAEVYKSASSQKQLNGNMASDGVYISCEEPIVLSFALRYLTTFSKGSALSDRVTFSFSSDQPCRVEYAMEKIGNLRWFLAPKVDDEDEN